MYIIIYVPSCSYPTIHQRPRTLPFVDWIGATHNSLSSVPHIYETTMLEFVPSWLLPTETRRGNGGLVLLLVVGGSFAVGYVFGSASMLDRCERFVTSSWWNLYSTVVMSYITIRSYQLFVEPIQEQLAEFLYGEAMSSTFSPRRQAATTVDDRIMSRRARIRITKDATVFQPLKPIDERGETNADDERGDGEPVTDPDGDGDVANAEGREAKRRRGPAHQQPIDMSGAYQLVSNDNFDEFLIAQGVPWVLARAADNARPIHRITHVGRRITIKIEGIIESSSTYTIDGPPVETLVRGRLFADQVTYLTVQELGLPCRDDDDAPGGGGPEGRASPTSSSRRSPTMILSLDGRTLERGTPSHRRTRSLDSSADQGIASSFDWMTSTTTTLGSSTMVALDDLMSEGLKSTFVDIERATTDFKKSFDDMIVKPLNDTIDGIAAAAAIPVIELKGSNSSCDSTEVVVRSDPQQGSMSTIFSVTYSPMERQEVVIEDRDNSAPVSSRPIPAEPQGSHSYATRTADDDDGGGETTPTTAPSPDAATPRGAGGVVCGIKTTKRAIHDGNTVTVFRHLLRDGSGIVMTSRVEFDDPTKEAVEANQVFERLREG